MSQRAAKEAGEERSEPSAVLERLGWQLARRDDRRVAQALYAGEELEEMHELCQGRPMARCLWVPSPYHASKASSGGRGMSISTRCLHLREQYVSGSTTERNVPPATRSCIPQ